MTALAASVTLLPALLAGCGASASQATTIEYWMWDANQLPAYEACAQQFERSHPELDIDIEQVGYDTYWNRLMTGFVSETAPDVFTNHPSHYPEMAAAGVIEPLNRYVKRDSFNVGKYLPGTAELWVAPNGSRYGLPKDVDAVGIFYNEQMARRAGITPRDMATMTWNPRDGGTFGDIVARLTVDKNGVRGNEPGFDPNNVAVHGLGLESSGNGIGQTQWSHFAVSNGWSYTGAEKWGTRYRYGDPRLVETISWWRGLVEKGYMPTLQRAMAGVGMTEQFAAGSHAMATNGLWTVRDYANLTGIEVGMAPLPKGPTGKRATMSNSLADSIWAGSDNKKAAWQWVEYLGSAECQDTVARHAVVLPAIEQSYELATDVFRRKGMDLTSFTRTIEQGTTYPYPITRHRSDVKAIMQPTMDAILSFQRQPGPALRQADARVNALFRKD